MRNCFRCHFRQLFICLALRERNKYCNILKIILKQGFCPLKTKIASFPIGFRLKIIVNYPRLGSFTFGEADFSCPPFLKRFQREVGDACSRLRTTENQRQELHEEMFRELRENTKKAMG